MAGTTSDKLNYLLQTKEDIKQAIIDKGVEVGENATFRSYADLIGDIVSGGDTANYNENIKTFGSGITVNNGVVSGFSANTYFTQPPGISISSIEDAELTFAFTISSYNTTDDMHVYGNILSSSSLNNIHIIKGTNHIGLWNGTTLTDTSFTVEVGVEYIVKVKTVSNNNTISYYILPNTNGYSLKNLPSLTRFTVLGQSSQANIKNNILSFGGTANLTQYLNGSFNLNLFEIKNLTSGTIAWRGASLYNIEPNPIPITGGIEVTGNNASFTIKAGTKYNMTTYDDQTGTQSTTIEELDNDITITDYKTDEFSSTMNYSAPATQTSANCDVTKSYTGSSTQGVEYITLQNTNQSIVYNNITSTNCVWSTDQVHYEETQTSRCRRFKIEGLTPNKTYYLHSGPLCPYALVYPQYGTSTQFDVFASDGDLTNIKYIKRINGNTISGKGSYYLPTTINGETVTADSNGKVDLYIVIVNNNLNFMSPGTVANTYYSVGCLWYDKDMTNKTLNLGMRGMNFGGSPQLDIRLSEDMPYEAPPGDWVFTATTDSTNGNTLVSSGVTTWVEPI